MKSEEDRRDIRLRDNIPVRWQIKDTAQSGDGVVRNLSVSGVLLDAQNMSKLPKNTEVILKATNPLESPFAVCRAKFMWGRRSYSNQRHYFSGLEFIDLPAETIKKIKEHENKMTDFSNVEILGKYIGLGDE